MKTLLYGIVGYIYKVPERLLSLNDSYEFNFNDKQLHFLVIGILGMLMVFFVHAVFKYLAEHNHVMVISWIYVFTLLIVITFAIEIGQGISHTGTMDFEDIVFGMGGFLLYFAVFAVVRWVIKSLIKLLKDDREYDD
ncbi:MAG: hypothetical protein K6A05_07240 [Lachnospiraceae bacterium]|nr:hypothetical protein [Lachnospiraceae bacterium]